MNLSIFTKYYTIAIVLIISIAVNCVFFSCTKSRPEKSCTTFVEMNDPMPNTSSDWGKANPGLNASFVSIDKKFAKSVLPTVNTSLSTHLVGWKGETLSAQILLWSAENTNQIECEFSDFKSSNATLKSSIAEARFVRYVMTDEFAEGCGYRKPEDFVASLTADMLDNLSCFDMEAKTARPVWLTLNIPYDAKEGTYQGKVKIFAKGQKTKELTIELEVQNKTLPRPSEWVYYLDLWQHPSAVARAQNLELWSDAHFEAMKPLMKMLADAGQKVITATINKDPWNNQCYDSYQDMITWTKTPDGTWIYDYTIFDKWVSFMMDLGISKTINCYSAVPWNNELHYKDEATGETVTIKADPGTKEAKEMWGAFLPSFAKHLKEKGWLQKTNIAMDERSPEAMTATMNLLKDIAPELGISLADNHASYQKYPYIKEISVGADAKVPLADIEDRRKNGLITTYYVCCADKFPNVFTFSEPGEAVYTTWYAIAAGYDGYLRWAYNSWVENPTTDSRFRTWPAGDTYIVYPDARSSIRFERLKEGIQDAEKIRILKELFEKENSTESKIKLNKVITELNNFNTIKNKDSYLETLNKGKKLINELSQ